LAHGEKLLQRRGSGLGPLRGVEDEGLAEIGIGQIGMGGDGLIEECQRFLAASRLLGEGGKAVQRPRVVRIQFEGLADELLRRLRIVLATGVEVAEHHPVPRVGRIEPQHLDEVVRGVVHVPGLGVDHGQIATCPVEGGLELEDTLVDVDGLAIVALAGSLASLFGQPCRLRPGAGCFLGELDQNLLTLHLHRDRIG